MKGTRKWLIGAVAALLGGLMVAGPTPVRHLAAELLAAVAGQGEVAPTR